MEISVNLFCDGTSRRALFPRSACKHPPRFIPRILEVNASLAMGELDQLLKRWTICIWPDRVDPPRHLTTLLVAFVSLKQIETSCVHFRFRWRSMLEFEDIHVYKQNLLTTSINYVPVQSTSSIRTPKGQNQVSALQRCPYYKGVCKERLDCIMAFKLSFLILCSINVK